MNGEETLIIKDKKRIPTTLFLFLLSICASTILAREITIFTKEGILLCFNAVIGSVFPFILITDLLSSYARFENLSPLRIAFERLFKINGSAISAFAAGVLCGFPLGVKVSVNLYKNNFITKDECERLIGFSNNTGPAFIISGIGAALRQSILDGVILYLSMLFAAIITGMLCGKGKTVDKTTDKSLPYPKYSFTESVKSATKNTAYVCAYVIIFSVLCGLLSILIKNEALFSVFIPFIEVSNASKILASTPSLSHGISLMLTSFAISFSGISVCMQAKSMLFGTDISMKTYIKAKLLQGAIAAIITFLFSMAI